MDIFDVSLPDSDDWLKRRDAGEFGFGITGWCADYPDPQNFLEILFHSDSDENTIGYSNPDVDALLDLAGVEPDHETRMGLYADAERLILADWVVIPVSYSRTYVLAKPYVKNVDEAKVARDEAQAVVNARLSVMEIEIVGTDNVYRAGIYKLANKHREEQARSFTVKEKDTLKIERAGS